MVETMVLWISSQHLLRYLEREYSYQCLSILLKVNFPQFSSPCFLPGDSHISQLLISIIHETQIIWWKSTYRHKRYLCRHLKGFWYWLIGLVYKLKLYGIYDNFLKLIENCLSHWKQRLFLNDQASSLERDFSGVSQESVLRPLLFLIYINNVSDGIQSICKIFDIWTLVSNLSRFLKNLSRN